MKNLLIFLLTLPLLAGCVSSRSARPTTETAIVESWATVGGSLAMSARLNLDTVDQQYLSLTESQIKDMMAYCARNRTRLYLDEAFDCDDIAREYRVLAERWMLMRFGNPPPPASLAMAQLFVEVEGYVDGVFTYPHALHVVIAVRRVDGVWFVIEPGVDKRGELLRAIYEGTISVFRVEI